MPDVLVRQAVLADLAVLAPLFDGYRQFYGRASDPAAAEAFLRARFDHGESVLFLATDDSGRPLGFTQLYPSFSSVSLARVFILNDLFVVPDQPALDLEQARAVEGLDELGVADAPRQLGDVAVGIAGVAAVAIEQRRRGQLAGADHGVAARRRGKKPPRNAPASSERPTILFVAWR